MLVCKYGESKFIIGRSGIIYVFPMIILKETSLNVFMLVYHVNLICILYMTRVTIE